MASVAEAGALSAIGAGSAGSAAAAAGAGGPESGRGRGAVALSAADLRTACRRQLLAARIGVHCAVLRALRPDRPSAMAPVEGGQPLEPEHAEAWAWGAPTSHTSWLAQGLERVLGRCEARFGRARVAAAVAVLRGSCFGLSEAQLDRVLLHAVAGAQARMHAEGEGTGDGETGAEIDGEGEAVASDGRDGAAGRLVAWLGPLVVEVSAAPPRRLAMRVGRAPELAVSRWLAAATADAADCDVDCDADTECELMAAQRLAVLFDAADEPNAAAAADGGTGGGDPAGAPGQADRADPTDSAAVRQTVERAEALRRIVDAGGASGGGASTTAGSAGGADDVNDDVDSDINVDGFATADEDEDQGTGGGDGEGEGGCGGQGRRAGQRTPCSARKGRRDYHLHPLRNRRGRCQGHRPVRLRLLQQQQRQWQ